MLFVQGKIHLYFTWTKYRVFFKYKIYRPVIRTDLLNFKRIIYISLQNTELYFHILTDLSIQIIVLWDMTSCTLVPMYCNLLQAPLKRLYTGTRLYDTTTPEATILRKVWYFKERKCVLAFLCFFRSCWVSCPISIELGMKIMRVEGALIATFLNSPRICLSIIDWVIQNTARDNGNDSVLPVCIGSFCIWYQTHATEDGRTLCCNVELSGRNSPTLGEMYCLHLRRYRKIAKFNYGLHHFCLFDRPSVRITLCLFVRMEQLGFSWNVWFEYFSNTNRENLNFIKNQQE
jgi:hypothetical protein